MFFEVLTSADVCRSLLYFIVECRSLSNQLTLVSLTQLLGASFPASHSAASAEKQRPCVAKVCQFNIYFKNFLLINYLPWTLCLRLLAVYYVHIILFLPFYIVKCKLYFRIKQLSCCLVHQCIN